MTFHIFFGKRSLKLTYNLEHSRPLLICKTFAIKNVSTVLRFTPSIKIFAIKFFPTVLHFVRPLYSDNYVLSMKAAWM